VAPQLRPHRRGRTVAPGRHCGRCLVNDMASARDRFCRFAESSVSEFWLCQMHELSSWDLSIRIGCRQPAAAGARPQRRQRFRHRPGGGRQHLEHGGASTCRDLVAREAGGSAQCRSFERDRPTSRHQPRGRGECQGGTGRIEHDQPGARHHGLIEGAPAFAEACFFSENALPHRQDEHARKPQQHLAIIARAVVWLDLVEVGGEEIVAHSGIERGEERA
jgi:hypothetical protein